MQTDGAFEEILKGNNATDPRAVINELFELGIPRATLTTALGMMSVCADEMHKNCTGDGEGIIIQRFLFRIEGKVKEIRGLLQESVSDHEFDREAI